MNIPKFVRHIAGFPAGGYPGSPTSDQRFWQAGLLWGNLSRSQQLPDL